MLFTLDTVLGFFPVLSITVAYLLTPMVYVLCGKKFLLLWYGVPLLENAPQLVGLLSATPVAQEAAKPTQPLFIPYFTPAVIWLAYKVAYGIADFLSLFPAAMRPEVVSIGLLAMLCVLCWWELRVFWFDQLDFIYRKMPFLDSWNLLNAKGQRKMAKLRNKDEKHRLKAATKKFKRSHFASFWIMVEETRFSA